MALFQAPIKPQGQVHVEFKAGKMDWDGKRVKPVTTKGKVVLYTSEEDQLMHFEWHDREKNEVGFKLLLINDAYLERIEKCTTGRVYILRMISSNKKHFFWMQEPKADADAEIMKKFNDTVGAKIPDKKAKGAGGAAAPAEVDPALRAILAQFLQGGGAGAGAGVPAANRTPPVPLGAVLTTEVLQGLSADEAASKEMQALLPEGQQTPGELMQALASPQLQASLSSLTQAIHSDQLPVLFASLGLDTSNIMNAAPGTDALEVLCRAIEAKEARG